jgi:putative oxidoreductase
MRATDILTLSPLRKHDDLALLALRLMVGAFLIWGVWDNIESPARMAEFETFLARHGFPYPGFMAPLSVWAQFLCGAGFVLGLLTRWAGLVCAINFVVAILMVDMHQGIRGAFPSACLVLIGLYLATHGPGRFAVDSLFGGGGKRR